MKYINFMKYIYIYFRHKGAGHKRMIYFMH